MLMLHPLAFVQEKGPVVDVTLVKTDRVLHPVVLELPVGDEVTTKCTDRPGSRHGLRCNGSSLCFGCLVLFRVKRFGILD